MSQLQVEIGTLSALGDIKGKSRDELTGRMSVDGRAKRSSTSLGVQRDGEIRSGCEEKVT